MLNRRPFRIEGDTEGRLPADGGRDEPEAMDQACSRRATRRGDGWGRGRVQATDLPRAGRLQGRVLNSLPPGLEDRPHDPILPSHVDRVSAGPATVLDTEPPSADRSRSRSASRSPWSRATPGVLGRRTTSGSRTSNSGSSPAAASPARRTRCESSPSTRPSPRRNSSGRCRSSTPAGSAA